MCTATGRALRTKTGGFFQSVQPAAAHIYTRKTFVLSVQPAAAHIYGSPRLYTSMPARPTS